MMRRRVHALARRVAARVPPAVREVGLALAAGAADGPTLLPGPPPGPVLVVAPHPDDETIGAGGALARHAEQGDEVRVVVATSGERTRGGGGGDVARAREAECAAACAALGLAEPPVFLRLPDGALERHVEDLAAQLRRLGQAAAVVYVPNVLDPHRDHRAANVGLARSGLRAEVYGYEVWSPAPVDVLLDVDAAFPRKLRALRCYTTALERVDYVRTASGLAAYRSAAGGLGGGGHAEAFVRLSAEGHAALVHRAGLLEPGGGWDQG